MESEIKDIGSNEFLKDNENKSDFLIGNTKGIKNKYVLNKVFSFLDNKNNFVAKLCKYNKKLMGTDACKKSFTYNKFLKVILVDKNEDVISKVFIEILKNTISSLEIKLSSINNPDVQRKFCFDPSTKKMHEAFKCRLSFFAMQNILFKIVSLQNSDFCGLLNFHLENKDYISENMLIDAITKIVNKDSEDRANQLFDIINNDENYEIKTFNFYAEKAKLKFPEAENRDLVFAQLCHIIAKQLDEKITISDCGGYKNYKFGWRYSQDLRTAYETVYPDEVVNYEKQPKSLEMLTTDLNSFKNQLEAQNLGPEQKQEIELKIRHLNKLIEIKKYTNTLEQIKTNNKALFNHLHSTLPENYRLAYYFMYAENPNKLDSVDFETETYLDIASNLEELHTLKNYYPQFGSTISKIFNHQGDFDQKFYECVMRYTNFNKKLAACIYIDNEHDPYCPYKEIYRGTSYSLFKKSKFYAPLKALICNKTKISKISGKESLLSDGVKVLRSLKQSRDFISHNKKSADKTVKMAYVLSKHLPLPRIDDKDDHQGDYFRKAIKPNQENNEIINKEDWPDLNVDENKKNIYEEWRDKIIKTSELYEKHYKNPAKVELKNKLSKLNRGRLVRRILDKINRYKQSKDNLRLFSLKRARAFNKIRTKANGIKFIEPLNRHINSLFDNLVTRRKKSTKKKLIIGSLITFICVCMLLYLNFIFGCVGCVIGVCALVFYGIYKSKSNKIQDRLQIPLATEIKSDEINNSNAFLARFKDEHKQEWQNGNAELIFPEIQQPL